MLSTGKSKISDYQVAHGALAKASLRFLMPTTEKIRTYKWLTLGDRLIALWHFEV